MKDRKKKQDELDTETTFANMNVEGFRWYRPEGKPSEGAREEFTLSRAEKRALLWGAVKAALPLLGGVVVIMAVLMGLAYLWLG